MLGPAQFFRCDGQQYGSAIAAGHAPQPVPIVRIVGVARRHITIGRATGGRWTATGRLLAWRGWRGKATIAGRRAGSAGMKRINSPGSSRRAREAASGSARPRHLPERIELALARQPKNEPVYVTNP